MIYYLLSVYIITEVYEWWNSNVSAAYLVNIGALSKSKLIASNFSYVISILFGSLFIWLISLFTHNLLFFCAAILVLFYIKNKLAALGHYLYIKVIAKKQNEKEVAIMQKEVLSPDSKKASKILQDHYKNTKK